MRIAESKNLLKLSRGQNLGERDPNSEFGNPKSEMVSIAAEVVNSVHDVVGEQGRQFDQHALLIIGKISQ
jgi:hypothetical protein